MTDLPVAGSSAGWETRPIVAHLTNLPSRLPVAFFWTTLTVSIAVLLGWFTPWLVLPALALVLVATWRWVPQRVAVDRSAAIGALSVLGLVVLWILLNAWFASEILLVQRDAGFLALEGFWLSGHADPDVPLRTAADLADALPFVEPVSDAFARDGSAMQAQGAKAFPALLALGGWVGGLRGVLAANLVIGGIALLAVYDVGRRLISARWALLPVIALMLSMPFLYFSRTPFTEPTNIVLTFGGLAVLWDAHRHQRLWPYALGGAMIGANALSRIDGAAVVVGLIGALALVAAVTSDPAARRARSRGLLMAGCTAVAMVVLGFLDLRLNSPAYLSKHVFLYRPLLLMLAGSVVAAVVLLVLTGRTRIRGWLGRHARGLGWVAAGTVLGVGLVLASRPLWMIRRAVVPGSGQAWFVAAIQRDAGVTIDDTRSYDEMTVRWLTWYYGILTVALALVGVALLARRAIVRRRPELVVLLVTLGIPSLLYLIVPSITPDQIWAMRRFLPAALPAMLLCAAWLLHAVLAVARPTWLRVLTWLAAAAVALFPITTWGALVHTTEYGGRLAELTELCERVEGRHVVVVRGHDPPLIQALRILCDVDAVEVYTNLTTEQLAQIKQTWGGEVLVAAYSDVIPGWSPADPPAVETDIERWPNSLYPQRGPIEFESELRLGFVEDDGSVTPIEP